MADGLAVRVPISKIVKDLIDIVDDVWIVQESELLPAVNTLIKFESMLVEPSAAIGLAGLVEHKDTFVGKKVAMIGVENAYPVGTDLSRIKEFHDRGARYMSLSHNGHSQFSDSNTGEENDEWLHNGLSELGEKAVLEMNKYGIMIDVSHPSKEAIKDMFSISKAPLIASHSSARALCNHSRNLDDELLELFRENGGVVQTVAFSSYLNTEKHNSFSKAETEVYKNTADQLGLDYLERDSVRKLDDTAKQNYYKDLKKIIFSLQGRLKFFVIW